MDREIAIGDEYPPTPEEYEDAPEEEEENLEGELDLENKPSRTTKRLYREGGIDENGTMLGRKPSSDEVDAKSQVKPERRKRRARRL